MVKHLCVVCLGLLFISASREAVGLCLIVKILRRSYMPHPVSSGHLVSPETISPVVSRPVSREC